MPLAQGDLIEPPADLLEDRVVGVEGVAALVHVGRDHGIAHAKLAAVGRFLAHDHAEQGGLARAVGADHADDPAGREAEFHVLEQEAIVVPLLHRLGLDHEVAQMRPRRDLQDDGLIALLGILRGKLLVPLQASPVLRHASPRRQTDPFQLACEGLAADALLLLLLGEAILLLLQPRRVIPLPGDALPAIEFQDPAGHVVQEVAVVGDGHHGAGIFVDVALEPRHALGIQVVGGLVQQQHIGLLQEEFAQSHATLLAARELRHVGVAGREPHGVHGNF